MVREARIKEQVSKRRCKVKAVSGKTGATPSLTLGRIGNGERYAHLMDIERLLTRVTV
jgi:hypothetical protein